MTCLSFVLLATTTAGAVEPADSSLEIKSDTMTAQGKENSIIFEGSVIAQKGSITLKADKMTALYNDNRTIDKVVAEDNVVLIQDERMISASRAIYDSVNDTVTFTGDPVFREGRNTVTGTKIIYFINEERSLVENSRVILHE